MKLTPTQIKIIEHRLEVPDAMWDACENEVRGNMHTEQEFDAAVASLAKIIRAPFDLQDLTDLEYLVLQDAVQGSTYVDAAESDIGFDITHQKFNAIARSYDDLLDKLNLR